MSVSFQQYLNCKPFGNGPPVSVPSHWQLQRLKHLAAVQLSNVDKKTVEGEVPVRLCNYVDVYKHDFISPDMDFMEATATENQVRNFTLRAGDVLITKDSEEWSDIAVPALVRADLDGVLCGYHLAHIRPRTHLLNGRYLARAFAAEGLADQFRLAANGITRFGLGIDEIAGAWFPVPPMEEQQAIADFLDRKTALIDAVIQKKERLIELVQVKRQALISQAVTKGLGSNVPMKDSGLWWLPRIPVAWSVLPNGRLFWQRDQRGEADLPLLVVSLKTGVTLREFSEERIERVAEDFEAYKVARRGDIAFNKMRMWQGAVGAVPTDGLVSPDYVVACPYGYVHSNYYQHLFRTVEYMTEVNRYSRGIVLDRNRLYWDEFKQMKSVVPSLEEQRRICDFIDCETSRINGLVAKNTAQIDKLREYRQTLISAAVTGKIDVRKYEPEASSDAR